MHKSQKHRNHKLSFRLHIAINSGTVPVADFKNVIIIDFYLEFGEKLMFFAYLLIVKNLL